MVLTGMSTAAVQVHCNMVCSCCAHVVLMLSPTAVSAITSMRNACACRWSVMHDYSSVVGNGSKDTNSATQDDS
eukprot:13635-Heterococcus_DN1.PRE.5